MPPSFSLDDTIALLERTPATLRALLERLPDAWTRQREREDAWSAFDVVGHLIDGERADWIPRARIFLAGGGDDVLPSFDRFSHLAANRGRPLEELLATFAAARAGSMATLRGFRLSEADLDRTARHPELGTVTLRQHLATWAAHDLDHLYQTARTMASRYAAAVGPWRAYLRIVRE
jgi:hypothetical protein